MNRSADGTILLGAHMSIAGGIHTAVERATLVGCRTMQIFVKNNNRWKDRPISEETAATYKDLLSKSTIAPVMAHATYLINLCARNESILERSRATLKEEFDRCALLGVDYLNFHPGSHLGAGEEDGIERIAESLNIIHQKIRGNAVKTVLETTAGQGTALGYRFDHLRGIIDRIEEKDRMGVCVDTCHVFAAGYDLATEHGYETTFEEFEGILGLERLVAFHINDSKKGIGSRVDRHEHIGKGSIGLEGFRMLMNDPRFINVPKILETPKGPAMEEDIMNMKILRSLVTPLSA